MNPENSIYISQFLCTHTYICYLQNIQKQPRLIEVDFHGYEHRFRMYVKYLMSMFKG